MFQQFNEKRQELQTYIILQTEDKKREVFWIDDNKNIVRKEFSELFYKGSNPACQTPDQVKFRILSNDKASSTIDINGDCIPDLVLESVESDTQTKYLEFYLATSTGYCLLSINSLSSEYLMATFADIGRIT
jgi:hypothetical protein